MEEPVAEHVVPPGVPPLGISFAYSHFIKNKQTNKRKSHSLSDKLTLSGELKSIPGNCISDTNMLSFPLAF